MATAGASFLPANARSNPFAAPRGSLQGGDADGASSSGGGEAAPLLAGQQQQQQALMVQQDAYLTSRQEALHQVRASRAARAAPVCSPLRARVPPAAACATGTAQSRAVWRVP